MYSVLRVVANIAGRLVSVNEREKRLKGLATYMDLKAFIALL